jgi:hypothetical protein
VFGDIGTSPLYAFRETFARTTAARSTMLHIHGVVSLIFWSMTLVVSSNMSHPHARRQQGAGRQPCAARADPPRIGNRGMAGWSCSACSPPRCSMATA